MRIHPPTAVLIGALLSYATVLGACGQQAPAATATGAAAGTSAVSASAKRPISFNRDIRPIFADTCFNCHGADLNKAEGGLSIINLALAQKGGKSGKPAFVPGHPEKSEAITRIWAKHEEDLMPPLESHKTLTQAQKELITQWVKEGATYQKHWAYEYPKDSPTPAVKDTAWPLSFPDNYLLARLESEGLTPAPEADRATLCRRLYQDLLGLPPTPAQMDAFLADTRPDAYEKLVDELLANPHYGERMATYWFDLVRYSNTVGLHGDQEHRITPYRDWVIAAFMKNMKQDQFIQWQLGGDLVEGLNEDDKNDAMVAAAFNRLIMTTHEGGLQLKEYTAIYQADRVRNTSLALMGGSMGCCQCHDHKYDPYSIKDFYALGAIFADVDDLGHLRNPDHRSTEITRREPEMELFSPLDRWKRDRYVQAELDALPPAQPLPEAKGIAKGRYVLLRQTKHLNHFSLAEVEILHQGKNIVPQPQVKITRSGNLYLPTTDTDKLKDGVAKLRLQKSKIEDVSNACLLNPDPNNWVQFDLGEETDIDAIKIFGRQDAYAFQSGDYAVYVSNTPLDPQKPSTEAPDTLMAVRGSVNPHTDSTFVLALDASGASPMERHDARAKLEAQLAVGLKPQLMMVTIAAKPRQIRVLPRGDWMNETGEIVTSAVPSFLGSFEKLGVKDRRPNRLDFGKWLTTPNANGGCGELTARVWVNRLWYLFHGQGLCPTIDDLGGQGEPCTHPELLDRLTLEYVKGGWDNRKFIRLLVTSRAYRMASTAPAQVLASDPRNLLFARQGRWRLPAEHIRDTALAASGLLVDDIGGATSRPYQPEGYYQHLDFPKRAYRIDQGESQWKRGVYIHWQRMFVHPAMLAFDAPSREDSCPRRNSTNTPLAALVALNDPTFVEAARALAQMALQANLADDEARCRFILRRCLSHQPDEKEVAILKQVLETARKEFSQRPDDAAKLLAIGNMPADKNLPPAELAACTQAARVALNLHETMARD